MTFGNLPGKMTGVRAQPEDLDDEPLRGALGEWGIEAASVEYTPVGFGDHHWVAVGDDGRKWFLTVADLDLKGLTPRHLREAMDTAAALQGAVDFVVGPVRTAGGETVHRLGPRYALSVFPFLDAVSGWTPPERAAILDLLAALHRQQPPPSTPALNLDLPLRGLLDDALDEAIHWERGPYAEPARALLARHSPVIRRRTEEYDRLVEDVRGVAPVVTHGEPHPGNLLRHEDRHLLVDWDTVGLAPPERDLWSVAEDQSDLRRYAEATGHPPDAAALRLYRLRWDLEEISLYVDWFRAPHDHSPDTEEAWQALLESVDNLLKA